MKPPDLKLPEFPGSIECRIDAYVMLGLTATSPKIRTMAMDRARQLMGQQREAFGLAPKEAP